MTFVALLTSVLAHRSASVVASGVHVNEGEQAISGQHTCSFLPVVKAKTRLSQGRL